MPKRRIPKKTIEAIKTIYRIAIITKEFTEFVEWAGSALKAILAIFEL